MLDLRGRFVKIVLVKVVDHKSTEGWRDRKGAGNGMKNALGRHVLCEAYGCDPKVLDDKDQVENIMVQAALHAGAEVREVAFHKFAPQGVSGVVVISESHLAIHTWPEYEYAAIDVFTCGHTVDPWNALNYMLEHFKAKDTDSSEVKRGVMKQGLVKSPQAT